MTDLVRSASAGAKRLSKSVTYPGVLVAIGVGLEIAGVAWVGWAIVGVALAWLTARAVQHASATGALPRVERHSGGGWIVHPRQQGTRAHERIGLQALTMAGEIRAFVDEWDAAHPARHDRVVWERGRMNEFSGRFGADVHMLGQQIARLGALNTQEWTPLFGFRPPVVPAVGAEHDELVAKATALEVAGKRLLAGERLPVAETTPGVW